MHLLGELFALLTVASLGIFFGAMLTEGLVLVPYWRSLPAEAFYSWYAVNDKRLLGFFGPLTWLAALSALAAAGKHTELRIDAVAYTPACPTDMGFAAVGQLALRLGRLCGASLSLGSVLHHQTSTGRPIAGRTYSAPLSR